MNNPNKRIASATFKTKQNKRRKGVKQEEERKKRRRTVELSDWVAEMARMAITAMIGRHAITTKVSFQLAENAMPKPAERTMQVSAVSRPSVRMQSHARDMAF